MSTIQYSELESKRFGMTILRGSVENLNIREIQKEIINNKADVLIVRQPAANSYQIQNLTKLGYEFFQADTLVYYEVDFEKHDIKPLRNNDLAFEIASGEDCYILKDLVFNIFDNYTNHYYSNKYLNKEEILNGYLEWVTGFVADQDKVVFLVKKLNKIIGFATCTMSDGIAEGILYGVLKEYSGGGIYSDIIRYTQNYYNSLGIIKMKVSTQIQNFAVQKVWTREGFFLTEAFNTIHINPLLNHTVLPPVETSLEITENMIAMYGEISSDFNHIHYEDAAAIRCGFEKRIGHGLIAEGEISRILGTILPGNGTIFINNINIFLAPLYISQTYKFLLTTPFLIKEKNISLCVVKVLDQNDNIIMISYNNVIKK